MGYVYEPTERMNAWKKHQYPYLCMDAFGYTLNIWKSEQKVTILQKMV